MFSSQASDLYGGAPRLAGEGPFRATMDKQRQMLGLINQVADGQHQAELASRGLFSPEAATTGGGALTGAIQGLAGLAGGLFSRGSGRAGTAASSTISQGHSLWNSLPR